MRAQRLCALIRAIGPITANIIRRLLGNATPSTAMAALETLEVRQLLSVSLAGTTGADQWTIVLNEQNANQVDITLSGSATQSWARNELTSLEISGDAGDDIVIIDCCRIRMIPSA